MLKTEQRPPPPRPHEYRKADSILALSGLDPASAGPVLARLRALAGRLPTLALSAHRRRILERACNALLGGAAPGEPAFALRPHIIEELRRVVDEDLARYLFYRYRYEVFPVTHEVDAYPPCVQIEPTSICNYRCVFCYQTDRSFTQGRGGHMGQMSLDLFRHVVDEIAGEVEALTLASRGEPLLCRDIDEMLAYVAGKFLALKINTNAWYLTEAKAHAILAAKPNTLVFSADAADPELYAKLRVNGRLDKVLANIERFAEIRARHYPQSRTITRVSGVRYSAEQDFGEIERFWHDHVDQVAFVDYNPWESVYTADPNALETPCSDLWRRAFVWWDGRFNPCDVDYKSTLSPGSAATEPLTDLWRGAGFTKLRADHLGASRQCIAPCRGCVVV